MSERGALAGLRVLDLTDLKGHLCARLLADMGADVIKIEPPGGDSARRVGPFVDDRPHRDRSLFFWFYNLNKRSLTLDLSHPEGAAILRRLAEGADVVVESFKPGEMARMGLGWDVLHALNPALVLCSIAPFGQTGPYSGYAADDSVLTALSGMLYVNGFPDAAPVRPFGLQAYHSASYYAAIATMCALLARDSSGEANGKANGSTSACRRRRRPRSSTWRPAISAPVRSNGAAARCTGADFFGSGDAATGM